MNIVAMLLPAGAGILLAGLFYGGLWFTVQRLTTARDPTTLAISSFFIRIALVITGFIWVTRGLWQNAVACLIGFEIGRFVIMRNRRCT